MKTILDVDLIINRLKESLKISSDTELAEKLGVGKSTISNWRKRNTIDYAIIFTLCEHIDLNYLIRGEACSDNTTRSNDTIENKQLFENYISDLKDRIEEQKKIIDILSYQLRGIK